MKSNQNKRIEEVIEENVKELCSVIQRTKSRTREILNEIYQAGRKMGRKEFFISKLGQEHIGEILNFGFNSALDEVREKMPAPIIGFNQYREELLTVLETLRK